MRIKPPVAIASGRLTPSPTIRKPTVPGIFMSVVYVGRFLGRSEQIFHRSNHSRPIQFAYEPCKRLDNPNISCQLETLFGAEQPPSTPLPPDRASPSDQDQRFYSPQIVNNTF